MADWCCKAGFAVTLIRIIRNLVLSRVLSFNLFCASSLNGDKVVLKVLDRVLKLDVLKKCWTCVSSIS